MNSGHFWISLARWFHEKALLCLFLLPKAFQKVPIGPLEQAKSKYEVLKGKFKGKNGTRGSKLLQDSFFFSF